MRLYGYLTVNDTRSVAFEKYWKNFKTEMLSGIDCYAEEEGPDFKRCHKEKHIFIFFHRKEPGSLFINFFEYSEKINKQ